MKMPMVVALRQRCRALCRNNFCLIDPNDHRPGRLCRAAFFPRGHRPHAYRACTAPPSFSRTGRSASINGMIRAAVKAAARIPMVRLE